MRKTKYLLLLLWLLVTGLIAFGFMVSIDLGYLQDMVVTDVSKISLVVIALYIVGLTHSFLRTLALSHQLNAAHETEKFVAFCANSGHPLAGSESQQLQTQDGKAVPPSFITGYVSELLKARKLWQSSATQHHAGGDILEARASQLRGQNEFGWFLIDFMLKVGFLGTLIGFILMLASVSQNTTLDASMMQRVLQQMSFGMSTALNTTLVSLVGGILLSIPYYMLGRALDELLETTIRTTDVHIMPRLRTVA